MFREFLDGWFRSESSARGRDDRPVRPLSLWVYGRPACLKAFRREFEATVRRRRRKALFFGTSDLRRLGRDWDEPAADPEERKRIATERRALGSAGIVVL